MTQRTTLTDVFGTPCMEGEALMAAVMYRPYDTGFESSYVTLRTPFFKITTDHYGNIAFKGTKAQEDGILRGFLLDVAEPVTFEGLVGRKGWVGGQYGWSDRNERPARVALREEALGNQR